MKINTDRIRLAAMALALAVSGYAAAHGQARPQHGGLVDNGGEITFEMVQQKDGITIFVDDHGNPVSTKGAIGELLLGSETGKRIASLIPSGQNRVRGAKPVYRAGDRLYVRLTLGDGSIVVGEFLTR
ncbi:hypothetical protein RD110_22160 [Rhodoferax koreense]|uniref:Uncharacterized protein n=1 Tax=Rhodoferax koreensis TaxID=1842727 RepID=A0A1P8K0P5_9BURK|nr:hypothetical protein [Rhodoferax koreense]APW39577.1 hypothetical protein RD110_22160 [Rhodoferax koreense]